MIAPPLAQPMFGINHRGLLDLRTRDSARGSLYGQQGRFSIDIRFRPLLRGSAFRRGLSLRPVVVVDVRGASGFYDPPRIVVLLFDSQ